MKRCTSCGISKPLSEFHKSNRATGDRTTRGGMGVQAACKSCRAEQRKPGIHRERDAAALRVARGLKLCGRCKLELPFSSFAKRDASHDGLCFTCRTCSAACAENWRLENEGAFKAWYEEHKAERATYWQGWYEKNRTARAISYAEWAKNHSHIVCAIGAKRVAKKKSATPAWANLAAIREFYKESARLTRETGIRHEVDHIYPLQGELVCGLHCEANLQIITKVENIRKKNRMPEEYHAAFATG